MAEPRNYASEKIVKKREFLRERRALMQQKANQRRLLLQEAFKYYMFERDCDELNGWINEKFKIGKEFKKKSHLINFFIFRGLPLLFNAIFGGSPRIIFAFSHTLTNK